ncbi:S-adenosyl-L-methionine-dependent methyltransferase [Entophlyctis helioformis]|nr:S-adenosyl-L-methionine-dependent methyltransferase [Entophlyctis helioformis]
MSDQQQADATATGELVALVHGLSPTDKNVRSRIKALLDRGADTDIRLNSSDSQDDESLQFLGLGVDASILHLAALRGNAECVEVLLQDARIPWNSVDAAGVSVGEVAKAAGFDDLYEQLVGAGVRAEFVLALLGQRVVGDGTLLIDGQPVLVGHMDADADNDADGEAEGESDQAVAPAETTADADHDTEMVTESKQDQIVANAEYLGRKLTFSEGRLLDSDGNAVMMGWETPLMELHAAVIAPTPGLDVLNVGFGLGIIDEMLQSRSPSSHTIIEAHPDVYAKMLADGWDKKPGVRILFGRWQDVVDDLATYDGIFFDTFGEYYDDLKEFHQILPNHLRESGVYSFFNGLAGTNPFFHDVSCRVAELDLVDMGFSVEFKEVVVDELGDDVWRDTKRAYWSLPIYRVPTVRFDL